MASENPTTPESPKRLSAEQIAGLRQPLPAEAITQHPTKKYLSSIKVIYVVERLNEVFGIGGWFVSNDVVESASAMVVVKATFTAPEYGIAIEQFGGNDNADRGDAYKGACTDALSKIGSYLYIGMDVYKGRHERKLINACARCGEPAGDQVLCPACAAKKKKAVRSIDGRQPVETASEAQIPDAIRQQLMDEHMVVPVHGVRWETTKPKNGAGGGTLYARISYPVTNPRAIGYGGDAELFCFDAALFDDLKRLSPGTWAVFATERGAKGIVRITEMLWPRKTEPTVPQVPKSEQELEALLKASVKRARTQ